MSDLIEGIAFSIEGLRRDADEIEACGGGNEAAHMRWAAARIAELEAEVARLREALSLIAVMGFDENDKVARRIGELAVLQARAALGVTSAE